MMPQHPRSPSAQLWGAAQVAAQRAAPAACRSLTRLARRLPLRKQQRVTPCPGTGAQAAGRHAGQWPSVCQWQRLLGSWSRRWHAAAVAAGTAAVAAVSWTACRRRRLLLLWMAPTQQRAGMTAWPVPAGSLTAPASRRSSALCARCARCNAWTCRVAACHKPCGRLRRLEQCLLVAVLCTGLRQQQAQQQGRLPARHLQQARRTSWL